MALADVLPTIHALTRPEKLRLIQLLAADLAGEEGGAALQPQGMYPVWSPESAFGAAAVLLQALRDDPEKPV